MCMCRFGRDISRAVFACHSRGGLLAQLRTPQEYTAAAKASILTSTTRKSKLAKSGKRTRQGSGTAGEGTWGDLRDRTRWVLFASWNLLSLGCGVVLKTACCMQAKLGLINYLTVNLYWSKLCLHATSRFEDYSTSQRQQVP